MMDVVNFHDLLTDTGQEAIYAAMELAPQEKDFLRHFQQLSRRFPREIARSALETAILRPSAQSKFPQAGCMYFTRDALQQASSYELARYTGICRDCSHIWDRPRSAAVGNGKSKYACVGFKSQLYSN